jgi:hypothetical protein
VRDPSALLGEALGHYRPVVPAPDPVAANLEREPRSGRSGSGSTAVRGLVDDHASGLRTQRVVAALVIAAFWQEPCRSEEIAFLDGRIGSVWNVVDPLRCS